MHNIQGIYFQAVRLIKTNISKTEKHVFFCDCVVEYQTYEYVCVPLDLILVEKTTERREQKHGQSIFSHTDWGLLLTHL